MTEASLHLEASSAWNRHTRYLIGPIQKPSISYCHACTSADFWWSAIKPSELWVNALAARALLGFECFGLMLWRACKSLEAIVRAGLRFRRRLPRRIGIWSAGGSGCNRSSCPYAEEKGWLGSLYLLIWSGSHETHKFRSRRKTTEALSLPSAAVAAIGKSQRSLYSAQFASHWRGIQFLHPNHCSAQWVLRLKLRLLLKLW